MRRTVSALCRKLLERHGFTVTAAFDGTEAVAAVREGDFDLILMDQEMPLCNGTDAIRQIRAFTTQPVIVGLTGNAMPEDVAMFREAGADAFMTKPMS